MALIKHSATAAAFTAATTALDSLANATASAALNEYDNSASGARYKNGLWRLYVDPASAPTSGKTIELFILYAQDGTNYPEGSAGVNPSGSHFVGSFIVRADAGFQRLDLLTPLLPFKLKPLLLNNMGQAFAATGNILTLVPFADELV